MVGAAKLSGEKPRILGESLLVAADGAPGGGGGGFLLPPKRSGKEGKEGRASTSRSSGGGAPGAAGAAKLSGEKPRIFGASVGLVGAAAAPPTAAPPPMAAPMAALPLSRVALASRNAANSTSSWASFCAFSVGGSLKVAAGGGAGGGSAGDGAGGAFLPKPKRSGNDGNDGNASRSSSSGGGAPGAAGAAKFSGEKPRILGASPAFFKFEFTSISASSVAARSASKKAVGGAFARLTDSMTTSA